MAEKYIVNLTQDEYSELIALTSKGKTSSRIFKRAHILLLANEGYRDPAIAETLHVSESTVHRIREKFVCGGVEFALKEEPRAGSRRKLNGNVEAFLVATACSDPPDGRQRWTMQLLAHRLVEIQVVDSISDETVRRCLKKTRLSLG